MSLACEACRAATSQAELNLSPAGQWLCRSCFGSYLAAEATRDSRAYDAVRRCTCGAIVTPSEADPTPDDERFDLPFGRDVYVCRACAKSFWLPHPLLNVVLVPLFAYAAYAVWNQKPEDADINDIPGFTGPTGALILGSIVLVWLARDFYYRWRYRRVY